MAFNRLTLEELLDPEFMEAVTRLQLWARRVARGGSPAEQRSRHMGSGMEFRDFRPYVAGDDFRAIDWNIYRRLNRVVLRLFEELEDLPLYLLVDVSDSMFLGENPRGHAALRTAFALASIALQQHDKVGVFPFGADLHVGLRPTSGHGKQIRVAEVLAGLEPAGRTNLRESLGRFESFRLRPGLVVLVSDFFDPAGIEVVSDALLGLRHKLMLVQLIRKSDADPQLEGDLRLTDCETSEEHDVSATREVLAAYQSAYARFQKGLEDVAKARHGVLCQVDVDESIVDQLAGVLGSGVHVA